MITFDSKRENFMKEVRQKKRRKTIENNRKKLQPKIEFTDEYPHLRSHPRKEEIINEVNSLLPENLPLKIIKNLISSSNM